MQKVTLEYPDRVEIELGAFPKGALSFKLEMIGAEEVKKRTVHRDYTNPAPHVIGNKHFTPSGEFTVEQAGSWLAQEGYQAITAHGTCSKLKYSGYLTQAGRGRYRFLKKYDGQQLAQQKGNGLA